MAEQLTLFDNRPTLKHRVIASLLRHANSDSGLHWRHRFYRMKDEILRRHGRIDSKHCDWQQIVRQCWSCNGTGGLYEPGGCYKCWGSGVYSERWIPLARWKIADCVFHIPGEAYLGKPKHVDDADITGYVRHERSKWAWASALFLAFWFDRSYFWSLLGIKRGAESLKWKAMHVLRGLTNRCRMCRRWNPGEAWFCSEQCEEKYDELVPF